MSCDEVERASARLRSVLAGATLVMLVLSWPLWVEAGDFPRVPFARPPALTTAGSWAVFLVLLVCLVGVGVGVAWRALVGASAVLFAGLILQDQHRFQPWAYQYAMTALMLAAAPRGEGLKYARWWFVALYAHSALSKLDASFCDELGRVFLTTAMRPIGLSPASWPPWVRTAAVLAMPGGELAVALLLARRATRRIGRGAAVALHLALIVLLGPWGLRQSTIVLVWNLAVMVEVWIAFGPDLAADPTARVGRLGRVAFWVLAFGPLGERSGWLDAWPAHALYASHVERVSVEVLRDDLDDFPPEVRRHVDESGAGAWCPLNLTAWSRSVRGVPVYPQARACLGLAEALAARPGRPRLVRVVLASRADPLTGRRHHVECLGLEAIRRQLDRYWLNGHPARSVAVFGFPPP